MDILSERIKYLKEICINKIQKYQLPNDGKLYYIIYFNLYIVTKKKKKNRYHMSLYTFKIYNLNLLNWLQASGGFTQFWGMSLFSLLKILSILWLWTVEKQ